MMEGHENHRYVPKTYLEKLHKKSLYETNFETDQISIDNEVISNDAYDNGISIISQHSIPEINHLNSDHFQFFNHEYTGLGLMYEKIKPVDHEHLSFEMYRPPFPNYDGHTSAPAAVYEPAPEAYNDVSSHLEPLDQPELNYQDNYYPNLNYCPESENKDYHHLMEHYLSGQESLEIHHIDPAVIECGYSEFNMAESAQNFHSSSNDLSISTKKVRSCGRPTNIVVNENMDRQTVKRLRNRVSASRCRMKKKVWITEMEQKAQILKEENAKLLDDIGDLEDSIRNMRDFLESNQIDQN